MRIWLAPDRPLTDPLADSRRPLNIQSAVIQTSELADCAQADMMKLRMQLVLGLRLLMGTSGQDPELLRRLLRAKDRMDAASTQGWPVRKLALVSGVSASHFARSFKSAFGVPPHRYLLTLRIERAKALLRDTDLPIIEIAFETGWNSLGTFGRTFRDIIGESPSESRARNRADPRELQRIPACYLIAAHRPHLIMAVSEKRRQEAAGINDTQETEVP